MSASYGDSADMRACSSGEAHSCTRQEAHSGPHALHAGREGSTSLQDTLTEGWFTHCEGFRAFLQLKEESVSTTLCPPPPPWTRLVAQFFRTHLAAFAHRNIYTAATQTHKDVHKLLPVALRRKNQKCQHGHSDWSVQTQPCADPQQSSMKQGKDVLEQEWGA